MSTLPDPTNRRVTLTVLAGLLFLSALGGPAQTAAQFPIEIGPECSPNVTVNDHPLDPPVPDPLTVQICSPRLFVDDGNTPTDTRCDMVGICSRIYIDASGVMSPNVLDTAGGGSSALTWAGNVILTEADTGPGNGLDSDTLDGFDSTDFLTASGKAVDSDLLDGRDSTEFIQGESGLRIIRGSVGASGTIVAGTGFSVSWSPCGSYTITYTNPFSGTPALIVGPGITGSPIFAGPTSSTASSAHIQTWNQAGNCDSRGFEFIAAGTA